MGAGDRVAVEIAEDLGEVLSGAGLHGDVDLDPPERLARLLAMVLDRKDVASSRTDRGEDTGEVTRFVGHEHPQRSESTLRSETVSDDPVEEEEIDVAAGQHGDDRSACGVDLAVEHRGDRHGPGRFDEEFRAFEEEGHSLGGAVVVDRHEFIHVLFDEVETERRRP